MRDRAADRAPVPNLRVADPAGDVVEQRVMIDDGRVLMDLPMRRPGTDPKLVVSFDDAVETGDVPEVDQETGLSEPQLEERNQAVATGQQLRLTLALREDLQSAVQVWRPDIVEGCGNHARPSSSAPPMGRSTAGARWAPEP